MTAGDLAQHDSGAALVAYLGQPDASPAVCDPRARTPHPATFTPEVRDALLAGLGDGLIEPALWRRCVEAWLKGLSPEEASSLLDAVLRSYSRMLEDSSLPVDAALPLGAKLPAKL